MAAAEEACQALAASGARADSKQSAAVQLALALWQQQHAEPAKRWASYVLELSDEGSYASIARRLLARINQGKPYLDMPWADKE